MLQTVCLLSRAPGGQVATTLAFQKELAGDEGFRAADISGPHKLLKETPARPEENAEPLSSPAAVLPLGLRTNFLALGLF